MAASASPRDVIPAVGSTVAGKYLVEGLLGTGGMGSVLEARHVTLGHRVALKLLHCDLPEEGDVVARFFREARATARLECEQVVRIFDIGTTEEGHPFFVMERLVGVDLSDLLLLRGPLDPALALECIHQITLGVAEAHAAGIIHRDLKPSNAFVTRRRDGTPLLKILDFGISKVASEQESIQLTQTRTMVGSPLYMSPEQIRDARRVDERSDVWSLGAILLELLAGAPAFVGDTLPSICASIISDEPRVPERTDADPALIAIALRCLEKDASRRYASAKELLAALAPLRARQEVPSLDALGLDFAPPTRDSQASLKSAEKLMVRHVQETLSPTDRPVSSGGLPQTRHFSSPVGEERHGTGRHDAPPTLNSEQHVGSGLAQTPSAARWKWPLVVVGVLALLASSALLLRPDEPGAATGAEPPRVVSASAPSPTPAEPPAPVAPLVDTYNVTIRSAPSGAVVGEGSRVLGRTPLSTPMTFPGGAARELVLTLDGYREHAITVAPLSADAEFDVELVAAPRAASPRPQPRTSSASAPSPRSESDIRLSR